MLAHCKLAPAGLLLLLALAAPHDMAQAATGAFAAMAGSWSGGGTLTMTDEAQERLRCRAFYSPDSGGDSLHLNLQCASDSYKFDVASDVVNRDGAISGSWNEASHNASGSVSGRASGNSIQATARGGNFATVLSLTTSGNRQSVTLTPQGTDVRAVSVTLAKR